MCAKESDSFSDHCTHHQVYYKSVTLNSYRNEAAEHFDSHSKNKDSPKVNFKKNRIKFVPLRDYYSCWIEDTLDGDKSGYKKTTADFWTTQY